MMVAHKTGTTGTRGGLNGSTNDVGVITLPNGKGQLALAVYFKASKEDLEAREMIIARIAKAAFDSWCNNAPQSPLRFPPCPCAR